MNSSALRKKSTLPIRVWLVEDNPDFLREFVNILSTARDIRLTATATNVAEGMALINGPEPADVLLVDLGLPDGSGLTLIREANRRWPKQCNSMVISVFGDEAHVFAALEAGAVGYVLKDSTPAQFIAHIHELHADGSPISPIIARKLVRRLAPIRQPPIPRAEEALDDAGFCVPVLSEREREVLELAARGYSYEEIAKLLGIKPHTVKSYVKRCYRKLQVHSKTEAIYEARRLGLLED